MWAGYVDIDRAIVAARAHFGDGPYVVLTEISSLDYDGYHDTLYFTSHTTLADAQAALEREEVAFDLLPEWPPQTHVRVPCEIRDVDGVRVLDQNGAAVKDDTGYNAEARSVFLLEVPPPVVGEPLFRALNYCPELAMFLLRYK